MWKAEGKSMASVRLEEVMRQAEELPAEEQLTLIADVAEQVLRLARLCRAHGAERYFH